jgi:hypothetical protein
MDNFLIRSNHQEVHSSIDLCTTSRGLMGWPIICQSRQLLQQEDLIFAVRAQGWGENDRGVSYTFGPDSVMEFLQKHDLDLVCRAHQVTDAVCSRTAQRRTQCRYPVSSLA